ncbi:MAG: hypothetical protein M0P70_09170 [Desulfobulbaceae bacterium]|nr:hypothetical protein [Desulfobulbaceae bacterium]
MECPECHQKTYLNDFDNDFFIGRNSAGIPFFKCKECGNLFFVSEIDGTANSIPREKGARSVPIVLGLFSCAIALSIFLFFGSNIVTWLIGGMLVWYGWHNIKVGFFSSQKLINEMCWDREIPLSNETKRKLKKTYNLE